MAVETAVVSVAMKTAVETAVASAKSPSSEGKKNSTMFNTKEMGCGTWNMGMWNVECGIQKVADPEYKK